MKSVLFIDTVAPIVYDWNALQEKPLGGAEATVIRVAEKLAENISVTVAQHNRVETVKPKNASYVPFDVNCLLQDWQAVIYLRNPFSALANASLFKEKRIPVWVWMHDWIDFRFCSLELLQKLKRNDVGMITVSDFHKKQLTDISKLDPFFNDLPRIERIYNPVADELQADNTKVNRNKLVFISSPHKGLEYTMEIFGKIKSKHPQFELFVTNPGYMQPAKINAGVNYLGPLPHSENIKLLRDALCLFYPNHVYPETFGLVLAEANAVGVPVLTHPLGAAPEILSSNQLINTRDFELVLKTVLKWHQGARPQVKMKEEFRLSRVIKFWEKLLFHN